MSISFENILIRKETYIENVTGEKVFKGSVWLLDEERRKLFYQIVEIELQKEIERRIEERYKEEIEKRKEELEELPEEEREKVKEEIRKKVEEEVYREKDKIRKEVEERVKREYFPETGVTYQDLYFQEWIDKLDEINLQISLSFEFNFLLNWYLVCNLHFDFSQLDFQMPNFLMPWLSIPKAKYGETCYGESVYDPPEVTYEALQRALHELKFIYLAYRPNYNIRSKALKKRIEWIKDFLIKKGVKPEYVDAMIRTLHVVVGKVIHTSYVNFATVNLNRVCKSAKDSRRNVGYYGVLSTKDFKEEHSTKTFLPYDNVVGMVRVDYCRVTPVPETIRNSHLRPLAHDFKKLSILFSSSRYYLGWKRIV